MARHDANASQVHQSAPSTAPASAKLKTKPAQIQRGSHSPEEIRQIEAKQDRMRKEADAKRDSQVGRNWISDQIAAIAKEKSI